MVAIAQSLFATMTLDPMTVLYDYTSQLGCDSKHGLGCVIPASKMCGGSATLLKRGY